MEYENGKKCVLIRGRVDSNLYIDQFVVINYIEICCSFEIEISRDLHWIYIATPVLHTYTNFCLLQV